MTNLAIPSTVRMIPIDRITVLNPRERNSKVFETIVRNIKMIGLKKPITVTPRAATDGSEHYLLVCGEGRLKAFKALGEKAIPALVVVASDEDAFIMSLAENIARRQFRPLELLAAITALRDQGYDRKAIAIKTGLAQEYVYGILLLLDRGEERLLAAVQRGRVPLNAAIAIVGAGDDEKSVQSALQEAYESGDLRGKRLTEARRLIEQRRTLGRTTDRGTPRKRVNVTPSSLIRTYQKEVERQKTIVKKAAFTQQRLLFVIGALRELFADDHFVTLLRAERLDTLPKSLADKIAAGAARS